MAPERFTSLTRVLAAVLSRRRLAGALALGTVRLSSLVEAKKKRKRRKKRKHKKKCGKAGGKPIKGKCCKGSGSVAVDGRCRRCDVCPSGCAYAMVQEAIDAADNDDTLTLCAGTFTENIVIEKNLTLVGAGDGAGPGNTILDGAGAGRVVRIETGSTVTLQNLRIAGGNDADGGGILNRGTVALTGCTVSGNTAVIGGGIASVGTLTLTDCAVSGNTATNFGGGILNYNTLELINSSVSGNTAANGGGGISNSLGTLELIDSSVTANSAGSGAGGIQNTSSGTVICRGSSTVRDNTVSNPPVPSNCLDDAGGTGCATCPD